MISAIAVVFHTLWGLVGTGLHQFKILCVHEYVHGSIVSTVMDITLVVCERKGAVTPMLQLRN